MDSTSPIFWDLLWLGIFGLVPVVIGWIMGGPGEEEGARALHLSDRARTLATLLVIGGGVLGIWPLKSSEFTTVLFAPGVGQDQVYRSLATVDAQVVWMDGSGELAVIRLAEGETGWQLFRHGAILVTGGGLPAGCLNFLRT
jgi:hypothetical protein